MTTTPPATFEKHGHAWTVHKPGDPCPCDGDTLVIALSRGEFKDGNIQPWPYPAKQLIWDERPSFGGALELIGWHGPTPPAQEKEELALLRDEIATMHAAHNAVVFQLQQHRQDTEDAKNESTTIRAENTAKSMSAYSDSVQQMLRDAAETLLRPKQAMSTQIPTPRSDEAERLQKVINQGIPDKDMTAIKSGFEFARTLERELHTALAERDEARRDAERLANSLGALLARGMDVSETALFLSSNSESANLTVSTAEDTLASHAALIAKQPATPV